MFLLILLSYKSAYYHDPALRRGDSESAVANLIQETITAELPNLTVPASGDISAQDVEGLSAKVSAALKAKEDTFGLKLIGLEFRMLYLFHSHHYIGGAFSRETGVPDKLRALDPPLRADDAPGHNLANDYWSEYLSPPYFEKCKYGTENTGATPAAVSLEWCIPSPPDYHHFNMVPKMVALPPSDAKVPKVAAAH